MNTVILYDPSMREAPKNLKEYLDAHHIGFSFLQNFKGGLDDTLKSRGRPRRVKISVPNFASVATYLKGTDMFATLPPLMRFTEMKAFSYASPPFDFSAGKMHMIWPQSFQEDAQHKWLRKELIEVVNALPEK